MNRWTFLCTVSWPEEMEMAASAHLTLVAPENEKCTVPIGAKQIAQAQSLTH